MQRRAHDRTSIWLPVELEGPDRQAALAVSHDASKSGLLLLTGVPFEVGTKVRVTIRKPPEGVEVRELGATIVRCEPNRDDPDGLWHHRVALQLDAPDDALEAWLDEIAPPPSMR